MMFMQAAEVGPIPVSGRYRVAARKLTFGIVLATVRVNDLWVRGAHPWWRDWRPDPVLPGEPIL
jgi:hypothetical protein